MIKLYIINMHVKEKKINKLFEYWLLISLTIVFFIIIVVCVLELIHIFVF